MKRLNITVADDLHYMLKISAAESSMTIIQYVTEAISEKIKRDKRQKEQRGEPLNE